MDYDLNLISFLHPILVDYSQAESNARQKLQDALDESQFQSSDRDSPTPTYGPKPLKPQIFLFACQFVFAPTGTSLLQELPSEKGMTITEQINMLRKYAEEVKCLFVCRLPFVV